MCLVIVAWQQHPEFPLIVAGNRDEFHQRPSQSAHWWPDHANIAAGRDLQAGGTWLGLHRKGRFATVTNFRDAEPTKAGFRSRGYLVTEFLHGDQSPIGYVDGIDGSDYAGFNLLACDGESLAYLSNRGDKSLTLQPGIYGLSNALLDSPWHKVVCAKAAMRQLLDHSKVADTDFFRLLNDREKAPADKISDDRLPLAKAHTFSAPFIVSPEYGTRCSTLVLRDAVGRWRLRERSFAADGMVTGESTISIRPPDYA